MELSRVPPVEAAAKALVRLIAGGGARWANLNIEYSKLRNNVAFDEALAYAKEQGWVTQKEGSAVIRVV
jgi:hypothetical protein